MTATMNGTGPDSDEAVRSRLEQIRKVDELRSADWRLVLPGDAWVQLRDPETISESQRRAFKEAGYLPMVYADRLSKALTDGNLAAADHLAARQASAVVRSDYVGIAMFVESWSYDIPVPTPQQPDSLGQLPGPVFDRLNHLAEALTKSAFFDPSPSMEADSPFDSSGD